MLELQLLIKLAADGILIYEAYYHGLLLQFVTVSLPRSRIRILEIQFALLLTFFRIIRTTPSLTSRLFAGRTVVTTGMCDESLYQS